MVTNLKGKPPLLAIIALLLTAGLFLSFSPASSAAVCGDGLCESGESYLACSDCPKPYNYYYTTDKDGFTCITGDKQTCTQACAGIGLSCISRSCAWEGSCGRGDGEVVEWCNSNPVYSTNFCDIAIGHDVVAGFCYCGAAPSVTITPEVKPVALCGNGVCESGESYLTCSDCPKPVNYYYSQTACEDSDGGLNTYVKGVCKDKTTYLSDSCSSNSALSEMYCDYKNDACVENTIPCANGCSDGACQSVPVCGNGVCESGESYLTCSDCPKPVNYYYSIKEQVKCVFLNSENSMQKCYSADANQFGCTGVGACVTDVYGDGGTKLTWKSSCGGYAYTVIDGESKYAEFNCGAAVCGNGVCESGESYLTCSDCPKSMNYYYSSGTSSYDASVCGDGICSSVENYLTCSDCPKPYDYAYSNCGNQKCEAGEDYKACPADCQNPFIYPGLSYTIVVLPGWNLISNPLYGVEQEDVLTQLYGNCGAVTGWYYSPKSGYERPNEFEAKKGYWLKSEGACKVVLTVKAYPKPEPYAVGLEAGWNMIGAPSDATSFESVKGDCNVVKGPYWYDPSVSQYVKSLNLEPGKGYFVKVAQSCALGVGGKEEGGDETLPALPGE